MPSPQVNLSRWGQTVAGVTVLGNSEISPATTGTTLQVDAPPAGTGVLVNGQGTALAQVTDATQPVVRLYDTVETFDLTMTGHAGVIRTLGTHDILVQTNGLTRIDVNGSTGLVTFNNGTTFTGLSTFNGGATFNGTITFDGGVTVDGAIKIVGSATTNNAELDITNTDTSGGQWRIGDAIGTSAGTLTIYDTLHTAVRWTLSSAGNVTINAPSSGIALSVGGTGSSGVSPNTVFMVPSSGYISVNDAALSHELLIGSYASGSFIGAFTNNLLDIRTNNLQRISIAAAGNVTINAPASGTALTASAVASNAAATFNGLNGTDVISLTSTGAASILRAGWGSFFSSSWNIYTVSTDPLNVGTAGAASLTLVTNSSGRLGINSSGNVTINAPTSGVGLTVNTNSTSQSTLILNGNGVNNAVLQLTGSGAYSSTINMGAGGAGGAYFQLNGTQWLVVTQTGNVTISAPTSGVALTVDGFGAVNNYTMAVSGANVAGSRGLLVQGGTANSSDYALVVGDAGAIHNMFLVQTNGTFGLGVSGTTLQGNSSGNVTINAPTSGVALTVYGLSGQQTLYQSSTGAAASFGMGWNVGVVSNAWNIFSGSTDPLAIGTAGAATFSLMSNGGPRMTLGTTGDVTINAPASGVALTVNAASGSYATQVNGQNGVQISGAAATQLNVLTFGQSGQTAWQIYEPASTSDLRFYAGGDRIVFTAAGNVTINAPTSGNALTVNGVSGSNPLIINGVTTTAYSTWQRSGSNVGYVGSADSLIASGASTDFCITAIQGLTLGSSNTNARIQIAAVGTVTVNAPTAGNTALSVIGQGAANVLSLTAIGNSTNGTATFAFDNSGNINFLDTLASTTFNVGTSGLSSVQLVTNNAGRLNVSSTGVVVINACSSASTTFNVTGASNQWAELIQGNNTLNNSWGTLIQAGTSTSDSPFSVTNYNGSTAFFAIRGGGTIWNYGGSVAFPSTGSTSSGNAVYFETGTGNNFLKYLSSSAEFKTNVHSLKRDRVKEIVSKLRAVDFTSLCEGDDPEEVHYGLIAEEVDEIDPSLVSHDKDGKPMAVHYERIAVMLLPLVQELLGIPETVQ